MVRALEEIGAVVEVLERGPRSRKTFPDALITVTFDDASVTLAIEEKPRAPYPNEIHDRFDDLRRKLSRLGVPTLVAPHISVATGKHLTKAGWSWLDEDGNADIRARGVRVTRRDSTRSPRKAKNLIPTGIGSFAVIRSLIATGESPGPSVLSRRLRISQPRASQVLARLVEAGFVVKESGRRWRLENREALLDAFLAAYRGPGGSQRWLFTLNPPVVIAEQLVDLSRSDARVVLSGDVAADRLVPWRVPTVVVAYADSRVDTSNLDAVDALGRADGNVLIRTPHDTSIFWSAANEELADPAQVIWDLRNLGGSDREEAAERVRQWLLSH